MFGRLEITLVAALVALPSVAAAQNTPAIPPEPPLSFKVDVEVVATTPLTSIGLTLDQIPAPVQTTTGLEQSGALDLSDFLNRRLASVNVNNVQGNPFQTDVNYRGYTASPLLGTPQGLSVYMDGVRLNQPFGEVVSWDLIPQVAISSGALMPGSNPLFGLNTLGGALSLQTKDGRSHPGTAVQASFGSHLRRTLELEHGGSRKSGLYWYLAGHLFGEDGWREDSPSDVRQIFGKAGWQRGLSDVNVTLAHANNTLHGNGLQELGMIARDFSSVYTRPDITDNRSTFLNVSARHSPRKTVTLTSNVYYRHLRTDALNGDLNEESLRDPAEVFNGRLNRANTLQHNAGAAGQATIQTSRGARRNQLTAGAAYDRSHVGFVQSAELGVLNPDRSVTGVDDFEDEGVDLDGRIQTWSAYGTDTLSLANAWHITFSGRYNRTHVRNADQIEPGGGPGSLDGDHNFSRFNPAVGVTFNPWAAINAYAGYSEGSRAATSIELGCANPEEPCKLPNAMAGDPALDQVVTRTLDAGVRGGLGTRTRWNAGIFRAENRDDILFVTSEQTGFGYFKNFGSTRRTGLEFGLSSRVRGVTLGASYTYLDATYQSAETVNGAGNSTNDAAEAGARGLEGTIEIEPGDSIPLIPSHTFKAYADVQATSRLSVGIDLMAVSSAYARGNENNSHEPDGVYYLGSGSTPAYAVINVDARYRITARVQIFGQIDNALDRRYYSAAQLGPKGFTDAGAFLTRPFPAVNGEFPVVHSTFFAPGAPRAFLIGLRVKI